MGWNDDFGYNIPDDWSNAESNMFDNMVGSDPLLGDDSHLQALFDSALFDMDMSPRERDAVMGALEQYMWDEYGIEFDDVFDWDAYRAWYENS